MHDNETGVMHCTRHTDSGVDASQQKNEGQVRVTSHRCDMGTHVTMGKTCAYRYAQKKSSFFPHFASGGDNRLCSWFRKANKIAGSKAQSSAKMTNGAYSIRFPHLDNGRRGHH